MSVTHTHTHTHLSPFSLFLSLALYQGIASGYANEPALTSVSAAPIAAPPRVRAALPRPAAASTATAPEGEGDDDADAGALGALF